MRDLVQVDEPIIQLLSATPQPLFGVGFDAVSAQDAWGLEAPGFQGMNLDPAPGKGMNRDAIPPEEAEKYFFHFPHGNASIARFLLRKLVPDATPGSSATDIVTALANYAKLGINSGSKGERLLARWRAGPSTGDCHCEC